MEKKVIITGGAGDLAQAISEKFHTTLTPSHDELNVDSKQSIEKYFAQHDACDLLICCAGIIDEKPILRLSSQSWDNVLQTNLTGAQRCAQAAVKAMMKQGGGHILFIGSYLGDHPQVGTVAYTAAKAALKGLTHSLALELGAINIRVNLIYPGFLETKMTKNVSEQRKHQVIATHALGRLNTPEHVANFIKTLDEDMPHTSGQVFNLDSRIL